MTFDYECGDCESTPCQCEMPDYEAYSHLFKKDPVTGRSITRLNEVEKKNLKRINNADSKPRRS